ncbi:phytanoyl-CoA dioxygenase family protein [Azospirillum canadense]|uniref:phytanoyl-CoA dioxygenase family protein n=1 Tax=Azospirillum canadense TaxID=403962 RepID=UPI0022277B0E|nr:phytanoyl-CoA dioxygenase family protein [Azospirillum canadense]MCW2239404.1 chlorinating enzyme [Azospirillum canadense]
MDHSLTDDQIAFFRREGYLAPLRAISAEAASGYCRRIEEYERQTGQEAQKRLKIKAHLAYPWMVELARNPAIVDAVRSLIGDDILLFGSSLFAKNGRDVRYVSWHQDSAYYGLTPHEEVTVWVAFTPSNRSNGCLRVIPRTHLGPDMEHDETYDANNLLARGQTIRGIDESQAVGLELQPGEFSMHHERTVHGSLPNPSPGRRIGLAFFYMPAHVRSTLGRRAALPIAGSDSYGHWDRDPEPRFDLDPESLAFLDRVWNQYRDESVLQASRAAS